MSYDDIVEIVTAAPDSQFRLRGCGCGSDNAAYIFTPDGWKVRCFDCGFTFPQEGCQVRHGAQVRWNGMGVRG